MRLPGWLVRILAVPLIALAAELIFQVPFGNLVEGAIFGLLYSLPPSV